MKLIISEKQLQQLVKMHAKSQELSEEGEEGAPEAGTSSDGEKKTGMPKWESGINRGPANQIAVTRWKDIEGTTPARGKANTLWEQSDFMRYNRDNALLKPSGINNKDYRKVNKSIDAASKLALGSSKISKHVWKTDDGENFFINLAKGEFQEALLDLRSVIMTSGGMATQTVIEVIFSETVVVPVVIESLNAAILINDLSLYQTQGDEDPEAGFRVIEDLLIYLTRGAFKLAGNGLKRWLRTPAGAKYMRTILTNISKYISSIKSSLNKLPNSGLKKYISGKAGTLDSTLMKIVSNVTGKAVSKIPTKLRKGIVAGLLVYISAEGIDRLIGVKPGTTKSEMAKQGGPSDEYMAKIEGISKPNISPEDIKVANDLNILAKKGDLKKYAEQTILLYKNGYPCLSSFYKKNLFVVVASTDEKDIFKINNKEYYDDGRGAIYETKTGAEFVC